MLNKIMQVLRDIGAIVSIHGDLKENAHKIFKSINYHTSEGLDTDIDETTRRSTIP